MALTNPLHKPHARKCIFHYKKQLIRHPDNYSIVDHCLDKLDKIPVDVEILENTMIGKNLRNLRKSDNLGEETLLKVSYLLEKWRGVVKNEMKKPKAIVKLNGQSYHQISSDSGSPEIDDNNDSFGESPPRLELDIADDSEFESPSKQISSAPKRQNKDDKYKNRDSKKDNTKYGNTNIKDKQNESSSKEQMKDIRHRDKESKHKEKEEDSKHKESRHKDSNDRHKDKDSNDRHKDKDSIDRHKDKDSIDRHKDKDSIDRHKDKDSNDRKRKSSSDEHKRDSKRRHGSESPVNSEKKKSKHRNKSKNSHVDFASAIMAAERPKVPKKEAKSRSSTSSDPKFLSPPKPKVPLPASIDIPIDINPNYQPLKYRPPPANNHVRNLQAKLTSDDQDISALISKSKNAKRTAVYSGSKRNVFGDSVPRLFDLCIHVLQEHVDDIAECGNLPYDILEPVLERAKPETLSTIEEYNPYLIEDTGLLWERICRKQFPRDSPEEEESWREMYERCMEARNTKLGLLTERVQQSYKNVHNTSRKTKLAYVDTVAKPPRNIQRVQERNGTGVSGSIRRPVAGGGLPRPPPEARSSKPSGNHHGFKQKSKVAPMMVKTLKLAMGIKKNFRK